jgi:hypothetical protein
MRPDDTRLLTVRQDPAAGGETAIADAWLLLIGSSD